MTQSVPPDPQNRNERQDELIAVVLALTTVGGILWWGMTRGSNYLSAAGFGAGSSDTPSAVAEAESDSVEDRALGAGRDADSDSEEVTDPEAMSDDESSSTADGLTAFLGRVFAGGGVPPNQTTDNETRQAQNRQSDLSTRGDQLTGVAPTNGTQAESTTSPDEVDSTDAASDETDATGESAETGSEGDRLPPPTDFTDIGADYWAKSYIDKMSQLGVVEGFPDGAFRPDSNVTRAEFASSLRQAFAESGNADLIDYTDITSDFWAKEAIDQATQLSFMSGYPDESFRPSNPVTRLEVIIALATGLDLEPPDNPDAILETYSDREQIPDWATEKVAAATAARIVISHPDVNRIEPNVPATRAEATSMIYLALANQQNLADIPSYYRVEP